uniref:Amidase domain-containing protein n=1 Tax=Dunaliella tertiolecta TaxID=3047 RepID=A0A7S3QM47_DUNTE|mmetsp:Transcript_29097/g.78386  ORF Transcript_29097/g.78386 Transcript_29097/m.78386 type:complete len:616 (+) Transcript_29097:81-1928(+)|eukprot:CAMPEP_0202388082 /NCGR_PEP_ID=MMETSP1127-20130417/75564_1 /ASSEMBLY_ACC=CAM_ASM_000462 /TAXON_ID=3047 /ORGANISM="Dunaliella tertiolecta, Strain CCMP1320" /LENGTH=615 /DNA_ID=CAMNT_0048989363 /DNA_START=169 /DNA_END=2016 /DNA_ORIENTATION=+
MGGTKLLPPAGSAECAQCAYKTGNLASPALGGRTLWFATKACETPGLASVIYSAIAPQSGFSQVLYDIKIPEAPLFRSHLPVLAEELGCETLKANSAVEAVTELVSGGFLPGLDSPPHAKAAEEQAYRRPTVADYAAAYNKGATTPSAVAERIIAFVQATQPKCFWFASSDAADIRRQAAESTQRFKNGAPRSVLEGVPYAVKDLVDADPYPTTCGTSYLASQRPSTGDAPYIAALRDMGAILIGKANMHEMGLGITGLNLALGTARNPLDMQHYCGGSSSGSAAVLAAGLCPLAIGSDGGGSIRIPSSFCGLVGLKPTQGRVSMEGAVEVDCSVATIGPMCACVQDMVILHTVMSTYGPASLCPVRLPKAVPPPNAPNTDDPTPLAGTKGGIYWPWFEHADPEVLSTCKAAVEKLKGMGMEIMEVHIPELELMRIGHNVTILSEMQHNFADQWADGKTRAKMGLDVRMALDISKNWKPADYIQAQRCRARTTIHFEKAMKDVDVLITPTTPMTAPAIPPNAPTKGLSDIAQVSEVMRFIQVANFIGLPAISVPVGCDPRGMPVGLQLLGKPWREGSLLMYAAAMEGVMARGPEGSAAGKPKVWIDPLTGAQQLP